MLGGVVEVQLAGASGTSVRSTTFPTIDPEFAIPLDGFMKYAPPGPQLAFKGPGFVGSQFGTAHGFTFPMFMGAPVVPDALYASAVALTVTVPGKLPQMRPKKVGKPVRWTVAVNCGFSGVAKLHKVA
jgi:hypothetical protein